jgi:hypothetical protein
MLNISIKIIATLAVVFTANPSFSQIYVQGKSLDEIYDGHYLKVCEFPRPFELQISAYLDYGQTPDLLDRTFRITNEKGEVKIFKSSIDLMNFIAQNGWELVPIAPQGEDHCLLFKRSKKD